MTLYSWFFLLFTLISHGPHFYLSAVRKCFFFFICVFVGFHFIFYYYHHLFVCFVASFRYFIPLTSADWCFRFTKQCARMKHSAVAATFRIEKIACIKFDVHVWVLESKKQTWWNYERGAHIWCSYFFLLYLFHFILFLGFCFVFNRVNIWPNGKTKIPVTKDKRPKREQTKQNEENEKLVAHKKQQQNDR